MAREGHPTTMDELIYRLSVIDITGNSWSCCCSRREAVEKIQEFNDGLVTDTLIEVRGYTDTADRAELFGSFRTVHIYAMTTTRLY